MKDLRDLKDGIASESQSFGSQHFALTRAKINGFVRHSQRGNLKPTTIIFLPSAPCESGWLIVLHACRRPRVLLH